MKVKPTPSPNLWEEMEKIIKEEKEKRFKSPTGCFTIRDMMKQTSCTADICRKKVIILLNRQKVKQVGKIKNANLYRFCP